MLYSSYVQAYAEVSMRREFPEIRMLSKDLKISWLAILSTAQHPELLGQSLLLEAFLDVLSYLGISHFVGGRLVIPDWKTGLQGEQVL